MRRKLGGTDINLFPVGLGAMPLGIRGSIPLQDAIRVIHAAIDAGMNLSIQPMSTVRTIKTSDSTSEPLPAL